MSVNLTKGQRVSLKKPGGAAPTAIMLGLGWDTGRDQVDLDASAVLLDAGKKVVDTVYFGHLKSNDGSVRHSGDNLTGEGDGDDEKIFVDLARVPANVEQIVFTVNSYRGQTFNVVKSAFVRVVDQSSGQELCKFQLSEKYTRTALITGRLYRHNGEWKFAAIGAETDGRTAQQLASAIQAAV